MDNTSWPRFIFGEFVLFGSGFLSFKLMKLIATSTIIIDPLVLETILFFLAMAGFALIILGLFFAKIFFFGEHY